jgi:hypothetical protein
MNEGIEMDGFQDIHCPGCKKRMPFQVLGLMAHLVIRYQCRNCKRLLHIKEGLIPVIVREAQAGWMNRPTD